MIRSRLLLASLGLLVLTTAACGAADTATSEGGAAAAPPAAGACLAGADDCQDTGGDMGATPPGGLPIADPDTPVTGPADGGGADPDAGQATQVEPTDGLEDIRAVGWDSVEVDPADPTKVTVYWWSGVAPCNALAEVDVATTDEAVTLTVLEGSVPADEPQACIEIAQYKRTLLTLDEEIGPRSILDGADG